MAWLLSDHHLSPKDLEEAAGRIRSGQRLAPPEHLLAKAREDLREAIPGRRRRPKPAPELPESTEVAAGVPNEDPVPAWSSAPSVSALLELDAAGPPGGVLPSWALAVITLGSVLMTPLPAWVAWWLWRESAPHASRQVRGVAVWTSAIFALAWVGAMAWTWIPRLS